MHRRNCTSVIPNKLIAVYLHNNLNTTRLSGQNTVTKLQKKILPNVYYNSHIDKIMPYWFVFYKEELLLEKKNDSSYTIPYQDMPPTETDTQIMDITPMNDGTKVRTYTINKKTTYSKCYELCGLRQSYYKLSEDLYLKAGQCHEMIYWDQNTKFCGACGSPMKMYSEISKKCTGCGIEIWPQIAIAVIVLVSKGDELLLVHAHNFKSNFYGLVAGFVETGETLEEAVKREVKEETNITIKNIKYYASQPWPYPCGLMIGFYAEYETGEICLQQSELLSGGWFNKNKLPQLPEKLSIARRLIDHWIENSDTK